MRRTTSALVAVLAVFTALSARSVSAYDGYTSIDTHFLRWVIVSHGSVNNSDQDALDDLDKLGISGDEFLYIRQDDEQYVILDRDLVERAYRAVLVKTSRFPSRVVRAGEASKKPRKAAAKRLKHEIHEIFEEAKARHLAERVKVRDF